MTISGVYVTKLNQISLPEGDVYHALKRSESSFYKFGEAYFSHIGYLSVKGWKLHKEMILNLVVPVGEIKFVIYDDRVGSSTRGQFEEYNLSPKNYVRLTIDSNLWVAFQGIGSGINLLLNLASIEHDPNESVNKPLGELNYSWLKV